MTPLKTFLVEDSPVIRENLIATLEEMAPVSVIGSAGDEAQAREWLATHREQCDLVIIDIFLRKGPAWACCSGWESSHSAASAWC